MKEITEIDDPRLVKGLAHPLRIRILRVLQDRIASPSEIAEEIGAPLGNVSYHVRFLARVGLIELSSTEPRRGAVEHYYRAVGGVRVSEQAWAQVPRAVRDAVISSTLEQTAPALAAAAAAGGFDRDDAHVSRSELVLDERGFSELAAEVGELVIRAAEIERGSAKRLAGGRRGRAARGASPVPGITAGLVMMLFEAGDAGEG